MTRRSDADWRVDAGGAGLRLDRFLADPTRLGSRAAAAAALERGKVFVNGREAGHADAGLRLAAGDAVRVWMDRPGSARRRAPRDVGRLHLVYEDAAMIVVDKPAGLLTVPLERRGNAPSALTELAARFGARGRRPVVVHRIDRDTSGLVVFARTPAAAAGLRRQFRRHEPERVYLAVVYGHPTPPAGTWRDRLVWDDRRLIQKETHPRDPQGSVASCEYRIVERFRDASLLEVRLHTGRRNQIRLQARLRGHTLVGERRYVFGSGPAHPVRFPRQALHASRLALAHPIDGRPLRFEAPLPADFAALLERLRPASRTR